MPGSGRNGGFDYVKMDWYLIDVPSTERIAADLKKSGRDIVLSVSNSTPFEIAGPISKTANVWRTTGDIEDHWGSLKKIASSQEKWQPYAGPGHWNDPDMLQIGRLGKVGKANTTFSPTRLTPDEQYFQMSFWAIISAPPDYFMRSGASGRFHAGHPVQPGSDRRQPDVSRPFGKSPVPR